MNDEFLKILNLLIREPNLSLAAEKLNTSQSNLSKILKKMEEELGIKLFERKGFRGLMPTTKAIHLAQIANQLAKEWSVNLNLIKNASITRPDLRVIGPLIWIQNFFIPFWYQSPWSKKLRLVMTTAPLGEINLKTVGAKYDVVISNTTTYLENYVAKDIYQEKLYLIFNSKFAPESLKSLNFEKYQWLAYRVEMDPIQKILNEHHFSSEMIHSYVNDLSILVNLVKKHSTFAACIPNHLYNIEHNGLKGFELPLKENGELFFCYTKESLFSKNIYEDLKNFIKNTFVSGDD